MQDFLSIGGLFVFMLSPILIPGIYHAFLALGDRSRKRREAAVEAAAAAPTRTAAPVRRPAVAVANQAA
ncbi:hypothetical protein FOS14_08395 [Skermania sp. ID1734]|uniref:hypothetical protein n=1 Tax=Skermania sp. ID1734 TaxID=2597516 RepID=UPI00117D5CA8|nr:hypothetical protein [Skermania sp. ID1734]TSE00426.1 hypothetical protein FOS14_08395 [Skermania sp. ID1734]